jgi:transketolase
MTVVVPCDAVEARKATLLAVELPVPVYLRITREKTPVVTTEKTPFKIGRAEIFFDSGHDVAIVACGPLVYEALVAAKELTDEGLGITVVNNHTIKPIDAVTLVTVARDCGAVVTVEEHQKMGGMGSAVAELLAGCYPVPMEFIGMPDCFGESGTPDELLEKYGMKSEAIKEAVKQVIARKK